MNTMKRMTIFFAVLIICTANALAQGPPPRGQGHQGPPPEAYTACEGKSAGDSAQFVSPHGDTVCGTCESDGDRLVLRPDRAWDNVDESGMNNANEGGRQ